MAIASFSGLASGIDSSALISGLVSISRQPITRLAATQTTLNTQAARVDDLSTKVSALRTAARALDSSEDVLATKASSADASVVGVTVGIGAVAGTYDLHVTSLAKSTRAYSDPVAAKNQTGLFGSGTLSLTIGGTTTDVAVTGTDTLASVAGKINDAGIGATASLFYSGGSWRLSVTGTETGAAKAVTFAESGGLTLGLSKPANLFQPAADAVFQVDGFGVTSASNTVTTAINGVTLDLVSASVGTTTTAVSVERDPKALETKVTAFVTAYNAVMAAIDAEAPKNGTVKAGALAGDAAYRNVQSGLRALVGKSITGLTGDYTSLASIGISLDRMGTMSVDTAKLSTAAAKNPTGVSNVFAAQTGATGVMRSLGTLMDGYLTSGTGVLSAKAKSLRERATALNSRLDGMELRLTKYEEMLKKQFAALESLISGMNAQSSQLASIVASSSTDSSK
jgi:flagellar hook-associated protein 2